MHRRFKQFFDRILEKSEIQFEIILGDDCLDESLLQKGPLSLSLYAMVVRRRRRLAGDGRCGF